jgi:tRNA (guanine37-N1)-methyltransferase
VRIDVATLFPGMCRDVLETSILRLARERGAATVGIHDIRDFTDDRHRSVDDRPYGGGPGMLLRPGPVVRCVERIQREHGPGHVVLLTPAGRRFDQSVARSFAEREHLVLVCGRYEGFDERIRELLEPDEISIGDFVLTGGELPALTIVDAVVRLLPGALGDEQSAVDESFSEGERLEAPQYTRPAVFREHAVPDVLLSGDHARIAAWRAHESLQRTTERRRQGGTDTHPEDRT